MAASQLRTKCDESTLGCLFVDQTFVSNLSGVLSDGPRLEVADN